MKYKLLIPVILFLSSQGHLNAQSASNLFSLHYDDDNVGRNIAFTYNYNLQKDWRVYGGLKWFINSNSYKNTPNIYSPLFKQMYTKGFIDHLGLKFGIEKDLKEINRYCRLYSFYDFQFTKGNVGYVYKLWAWGIPPYEVNSKFDINAYANALGLGTVFKVNRYTNLNVYAGLGVTFFRGRASDPSMANYFNKEWAISRMFGASLNYNLKPSMPPSQSKRSKQVPDYKYNSITLNYDDIQTGRNFNLSFRYAFNKHIGILAGLKYQMGGRLSDDYIKMEKEESYYYKQFQPQTLTQRLGLTTGIEYEYFLPQTNVSITGFYNFQAMRSTVKNLIGFEEFSTPLHTGVEEGYLLTKITGTGLPTVPYASYRMYGPVIALENYIGAGIKLKCSDQINFNIRGGVGYNFYIGPDTYQPYDIRNFTQSAHYENVPWTAKKSELSRMFSVGLEYKLGRKS